MKILYINLSTKNSRDKVTIRGLKECGHSVTEIIENSQGLRKFYMLAKKHRPLKNDYDMAFVGYTGGILVPLIRLVSKKKIVYNALSSLYEGMVVSRGNGFSLKAPWYYIIDFFAFHSANYVVLESEAQKKFIAHKFFLWSSKIIVNYTGADDGEFYFDPKIQKLPIFTAVFRGKFMPEAGIEILLQAAKLLEKEEIQIRIIGNGFLEKRIKENMKRLKNSNIELIDTYLQSNTLRQKMAECHVALGQLSDHPRLLRTIPHKAFEALAMKLPYLTARKGAIMELIKEGETALFFNPGSQDDLAEKIILAKRHFEILEKIAAKGYNLFLKELTPNKLAGKLLQDLGYRR